MDSLDRKMQRHRRPLAYRLRSSVQCHPMPGGKTALVLSYPLRAVVIDAGWRPVVDRLAHGAWASAAQLSDVMPRGAPDQIERFCNQLIRKGYAVQRGYPEVADADYPTVSVIVPVRNRPAQISVCLQSLHRLDYPAEKLEIIVVDDASEDATADAVVQWPGVRLIRMAQHRQASFCRNRAAESAGGDILAFIDSDCLADSTWLKELVPAFQDSTLGAIGGRIDAACETNGLDRYEKVKSALIIGAWIKRSDQSARFFYVPACNFLVRREIFIRLGGFRESLHVGEDVDFCWRLQDAGAAMEYRPLGRVAHRHRNRLTAFCIRRFDYGTSEPMLQQLHMERIKTLYLPWAASLWWLSVIASIGLMSVLPFLAGTGLLAGGIAKKYRLLKRGRIPVSRRHVAVATVRGYFAFIHHCCSFISRYYLVGVPVILPLAPTIAAVMAGMHLAAGVVEYIVKKPRQTIFSFLAYFTLEQVSYQAGVWWTCIRRTNFKPVFPRITHRRV